MFANFECVKLSEAQKEDIKKIKCSSIAALTLVSTLQPSNEKDINELCRVMTTANANIVLLHIHQDGADEIAPILQTVPGFKNISSGSPSLQLMVHQKLDIERIQVSESEDINSIWLVVTEEDIITSDNRRNGVGIDRQTLIGCVENMGQGGEEALVRQIISVKNKFHPAIDMMLVFVGNARAVHIPTIISAGVGASDSFSKNGMTLIVSPNVRYNLNEEEDGGLVTARQDKRLCVTCDEGFRTSADLLEHKMSTDHSQTLVYQRYQKQKHRMLRTPHRLGLEISVFEADPEVTMDPEYNIVYIEAKPNETKQFKLRLRNVRLPEGNENLDPVNDPKGIILDRFGLMKKIPQTEAQFVLEDSRGLIAGVKFRLKYNKRINVAVKAVGKQIGLHQVPVLAGFYHETHSDIQRDSDGDMAYVLTHMGIEIILQVKP